MKLSFKKTLTVILTLLALTFSAIGVTPAYADWIFANKTTANGLGSNYVSGVFASGSTVYAATWGGLSISTNGGATFANKTTANGLGSNGVRGVFASGSTVYAATNGGLSISTNGGATFANKTTANGLGHNWVMGVFASGSTVYAATDGGLSISTNSGGSFVNRTTANGLGSNSVDGVFASGSTIYAATVGGLSISTNGGATFANKTTANGMGSNDVYGVFASGSTVYAATDGGLSISTNGGATFANKTTANGLGSNYVNGVFASGSTVYAATEGGLSISTNSGGSFVNRTTANGLGSNTVWGVFASGGTVYAATNGGLSIGNNTLTFRSVGANDGWVLESSETSSAGGTMNSAATVFRLGDDASNRQYRAILSFNTSGLPDDAVITKVTLKIKKQGLAGTDPFTTHSNILVDIRKGAFSGSNALQLTDFQVAASRNAAGTIKNTPSSGWYSVTFNSSAFPYINLTGMTQFRLRFAIDDNNDNGADYLKFYSGNYSSVSLHPLLVIQYYVP